MSFITKKIRRNESCINNRPFPVVNRTQTVGTPSILVHGEKDVKDKDDSSKKNVKETSSKKDKTDNNADKNK
jgi:hypothetical protein